MSYRVFDTTELLEGILQRLPLQDLLRVQSVCKRWQDVIKGSLVLQKQLFFKPAATETIYLVDITNLPSGPGPLPRVYNPQLRIKAAVPINSVEARSHHGLIATAVRLNPLCVVSTNDHSITDADGEVHVGKLSLNWTMERNEYSSTDSWLNMFLTQPPVQNITFEISVLVPEPPANHPWWTSDEPACDAETYEIRSRKIYVEGGVRFRDLDAALAGLGRPTRTADPTVYMHGAVALRDEDADVVRDRTAKWLKELEEAEESEAQDQVMTGI